MDTQPENPLPVTTVTIPTNDSEEKPAELMPTSLTMSLLNNRYQPQKILGQGSFGAAYLAEDIKLKRLCVVKQMLAPQGRSAQTLALYYSNFEREASLLAQLNQPGHPNIPEIYDYFSDDQGTYLVMKYIEGNSLKEMLDPEGTRLPWRDAVRYMIDVCSAVQYMHTGGPEPIIHRDIKPANILLGNNGRIWLVDFGLAKAKAAQGDTNMMGTQASGSIGYSPMEQWLGQTVPASDVYALGATLHHMVTGLHPARNFGNVFDFEKLQSLHEQFDSPHTIDRDIPEALGKIIASATALNPEHRPSPIQLQQELELLLAGPTAKAVFTFKSGFTAKTPKELALLCAKFPFEAENYLYNGDFERWFYLTNRHDLVEAARQTVKKNKNRHKGLKRFIGSLAPRFTVKKFFKFCWHSVIGLLLAVSFLSMILTVLVIGLSYSARIALQEGIGTYAWNFSQFSTETPNRLPEKTVNTDYIPALTALLPTPKLQSHEESVTVEPDLEIDYIDFRYPNQIDVHFDAKDPILTLLIHLDNGTPQLYPIGYHNSVAIWIGGNVSLGVNQGIKMAFQRANLTVSKLIVNDADVVFSLTPKKLPEPLPVTATPEP